MVKYLMEVWYQDVAISIIIKGATPAEAETFLRTNHGDKTVDQLLDWFKANVGELVTDFERTCCQ